MPREARLGPDWLTSMLAVWGRRQLESASRSCGFYTVNPMLKDGIPQNSRSYEPEGYCAADFDDMERCIGQLERYQQLALARYCMPWRIRIIDEEHPHMTNRRWLVLLRESLATLAAAMSREAA